MSVDSSLLRHIKATVIAVEPSAEVILFGSRARGDEREDSDWDLLILVPYAVDLSVEQRFRHQLFNLELEYGVAISTHVKCKSDWEGKLKWTPLHQNIKQEGIRI